MPTGGTTIQNDGCLMQWAQTGGGDNTAGTIEPVRK